MTDPTLFATGTAGAAQQAAGRLALFDLDHTLLPLDSDYEWARFLARLGVVDETEQQQRNQYFMDQYRAGLLDMTEFLQFQLAPLAAHPRETLDAWHQRYMQEVIRPAMRPAAIELVRKHQQAGDLCAIITATNEFVTAPIAQAFGIAHLVATGIESINGRFTGRPRGTPSFREGKLTRTDEWLATLGLRFEMFSQTYFYSDSANDIPLLSRVSHPVATNPDVRLEALARERGWTVLRLFD
jgi:HAD superfamily hydrolase (TIGR01490 family)